MGPEYVRLHKYFIRGKEVPRDGLFAGTVVPRKGNAAPRGDLECGTSLML